VTLEPVTSEIDHDFSVLLCEDTGDEERLAELDDDIELFSGDSIDIGEIAAVELALCVDPYPRAPGIPEDAPGPDGEKKDETAPGNRPFEVLASLKRPDKSR
jgi:uncharacterized metal-binding protein YceD (DUF177 family)